MSAPDHDALVASAHALMDTLARAEAESVAIKQAGVVTAVLETLADVARGAIAPVLGSYDTGYRDGQVDLVRQLHEVITRGLA
jgi:hypothetical protein